MNEVLPHNQYQFFPVSWFDPSEVTDCTPPPAMGHFLRGMNEARAERSGRFCSSCFSLYTPVSILRVNMVLIMVIPLFITLRASQRTPEMEPSTLLIFRPFFAGRQYVILESGVNRRIPRVVDETSIQF